MSNSPLGFAEIAIYAPELSSLTPTALSEAINIAAKSRGIEITENGSDDLDASRDVILMDAVEAAGGGEWEILDDTLHVAVPGLRLADFLP